MEKSQLASKRDSFIAKIQPIHDWTRDRIRSIRIARGFTQDYLGRLVGYPDRSRVSDFEKEYNKDFQFSTFLRMLRGLSVSPSQVFIGCPPWKLEKSSEILVVEKARLAEALSGRFSPSIHAAVMDTIEELNKK